MESLGLSARQPLRASLTKPTKSLHLQARNKELRYGQRSTSRSLMVKQHGRTYASFIYSSESSRFLTAAMIFTGCLDYYEEALVAKILTGLMRSGSRWNLPPRLISDLSPVMTLKNFVLPLKGTSRRKNRLIVTSTFIPAMSKQVMRTESPPRHARKWPPSTSPHHQAS